MWVLYWNRSPSSYHWLFHSRFLRASFNRNISLDFFFNWIHIKKKKKKQKMLSLFFLCSNSPSICCYNDCSGWTVHLSSSATLNTAFYLINPLICEQLLSTHRSWFSELLSGRANFQARVPHLFSSSSGCSSFRFNSPTFRGFWTALKLVLTRGSTRGNYHHGWQPGNLFMNNYRYN